MDFEFSTAQAEWKSKGDALGRTLPEAFTATDVATAAARAGLLDGRPDLLSLALAVESLACESAAAALVLAMHGAAALSVDGGELGSALARGERVGALTLSTEEVPQQDDGTLEGRASWVGPLTDRGVALIGVRRADVLVACAVLLDGSGLQVETVKTAGLDGFVCGHLTLADVPGIPMGATQPVMARARILIAAAGLGMGGRAVREALTRARGTSHGAGGEQTVQGLVADAATELEAARLLTWRAAIGSLSLGAASMAKLAATGAAQRAVEHATQVIGSDSIGRGHIIEKLARDVRALELFAGRTEALREAIAAEELPQA